MSNNGKVPKEILTEVVKNTLNIQAEYNKYFDQKISLDNLWKSILPILKELASKTDYSIFMGERNLESIGNLKLNLRDKIQRYREYQDMGDQEGARKEELQFGHIVDKVISRLNEISEDLKIKCNNTKENENFDLKNPKTRSQIIKFQGEKRIFVGREWHISKELRDKITNNKVVSIVGIGGIGKTQLAYKALHKYTEERIFDIVIPMYFSKGLPRFLDFLSDMAQKLNLPMEDFDKRNLEEKKSILYEDLINRNNPLIFLDSYETISEKVNKRKLNKSYRISQDVKSIDSFLSNSLPNNTSILLTSREQINNLQEDPVLLSGLKTNHAKELFLEVAKPVLKSINILTIEKDLTDLVAFTGGHPLSLELIAKNISSVYEIKDIIKKEDISSLDSNNEDGRLTSLKACFDYTIDKLDKDEKDLLFKLTIFKSPFSISVAEDIFDSTFDNMVNLYNKSLLIRIDSDSLFGDINDLKYYLYDFHLAVRNYIETIIKDKENILIQHKQKFIYFYYCLVKDTYESLGKDNHNSSMARFNNISKVRNNDFDRAIEFGLSSSDSLYKVHAAGISNYLGIIFRKLGQYSLSLRYHKQALEIYESTSDNLEMADIYNNIGITLKDKGDQDGALRNSKKALELHNKKGDKEGMARDYSNIGLAFFYKGQLDDSLVYSNKALEIDEELKDKVGIAREYGNIGKAYYYKGQLDEALEYHNMALEKHKELKDRLGMARNYGNIGLAYYDKGQLDEALDSHNKALEIHKEMNDRLGIAKNYTSMGMAYRDKGQLDEALEYHNMALKIHEELKDNVMMARDYSNIGLAFFYKGQLDEALDSHNKALAIHEKLNDRIRMAKTYTNIGMTHRDKGQLDEALESHNKALDIDEELKDKVGKARDLASIGLAYKHKGQLDEALAFLSMALDIHNELKDKVEEAKDYSNIGLAFFYKGQLDEALEYHNMALKIHEELKDNVMMARDYSNIGLAFFYKGQLDEALDSHNKALAIHEKLNDRIRMAKTYHRISTLQYTCNKGVKGHRNNIEEAIINLKKSKNLLDEFKNETGFSHPFLKKVQKQLEELENIKINHFYKKVP